VCGLTNSSGRAAEWVAQLHESTLGSLAMRLWSYAIAMTVAAIAAGYFALQLHAEEQRLGAAYAACSEALEPSEARARVAERRAQTCEDDILGIADRLLCILASC
jgi:hypothetical protein